MELIFGQVENAFAERFGISEDRASLFRARLQHLQRQKAFPDGVNTGKGKKAIYGWRQVLQLMVGLDLIDLGFTPDAAVERVRGKGATDRLTRAAYEVTHGFGELAELHNAIKATICPVENTAYVLCSAAALSFGNEAADPYLVIVDQPGLLAALRDDPGLTPATAVFDFGSRLMVVCAIIAKVIGADVPALANDLVGWTEESVHGNGKR